MSAAPNLKKGQIIQYCGLRVADGCYAIPVLDIQEVIRPQIVTPIPLSQDYVKGLINLRGQIVTSISLRKLFGMEEDLSAPHMNIIVRQGDSLTSLVVDEIMDVIDIDTGHMAKTPDTVSPKLKGFIDSVYRSKNDLVILLSLNKVLAFNKGE